MALFGERAEATGLRHGTVTVLRGTERVEVTTFRRDGAIPGPPAAGDRDIYGLAYRGLGAAGISRSTPWLWTGAGRCATRSAEERTLKVGSWRCVGTAEERLREDALRILRGLRFSACLGLVPEAETEAAMHRCASLLEDIAPERIWEELRRLLCGRGRQRSCGASRMFWRCSGRRRLPWWALTSTAGTTATMCGSTRSTPLPLCQGRRCCAAPHCYTMWGSLSALPWTQLGTDIFPAIRNRGRSWRTPCCGGCGWTTAPGRRWCAWCAGMTETSPEQDAGIGRALSELGEEDLRRLLAIKRADNLAQARQDLLGEIRLAGEILDRLVADGACVRIDQLAVRGGDLAELGLAGVQIGRTLRALLDAVLDGTVPNDRESLMQYARKIMEETV